MKHCCDIMDYYAASEYLKDHELVEYAEEVKRYSFILHGKDHGMNQVMSYCPWCGKKLPDDLEAKWAELVKKQLGIKRIFDIEWDDIPDEFKTDEWWKKRGL